MKKTTHIGGQLLKYKLFLNNYKRCQHLHKLCLQWPWSQKKNHHKWHTSWANAFDYNNFMKGYVVFTLCPLFAPCFIIGAFSNLTKFFFKNLLPQPSKLMCCCNLWNLFFFFYALPQPLKKNFPFNFWFSFFLQPPSYLIKTFHMYFS